MAPARLGAASSASLRASSRTDVRPARPAQDLVQFGLASVRLSIEPANGRVDGNVLIRSARRARDRFPHGARCRLRVETQLGFKMVKYLRSIELVEDYRAEGRGGGGSREDVQFYGVEAGI